MSPATRRSLASGLLFAPVFASAQPAKSVVVIIPFPPTATLDRVGRAVTEACGQSTGQIYEIENWAGANGSSGGRFGAKSAPDGNTWLFGPDSLVTANPALYAGHNSFDAEHDLKIVAPVGILPSLLVINPRLGPKTLAEFVAFARVNRVSFASGGVGSAGHLSMEYFGETADLRFRHIPYRGGAPAIADVISGQANAAFVVAGNALDAVSHGELLALAVSTGQRLPLHARTSFTSWLTTAATPT